jgi:hypothetical protein
MVSSNPESYTQAGRRPIQMNRCRECNATMTKTETTCLGCGSELEVITQTDRWGGRFRVIIKILFFASAALTIASLFWDATPPFSRCAITTLVLLVVMSSADQMKERKKS